MLAYQPIPYPARDANIACTIGVQCRSQRYYLALTCNAVVLRDAQLLAQWPCNAQVRVINDLAPLAVAVLQHTTQKLACAVDKHTQ